MTRHAGLALVAAAALLACSPGGSSAADDGGADVAQDAGPEAAAALGLAAVRARQCAACHQSPDPEDGVLSGQTTPVPGTHAYGSNLTPDPETGMDGWTVPTIVSAILDARAYDGGALCPAMPAYADAGMGPDEATQIALYLQGLTAVWHPVPPSACGVRPDGG